MRPGDERREAGADTGDFAGWSKNSDAVPGAWGGATVTTGPPKARSGLVLFVAFLVEAVIIAAVGNQYVADKIANTRPDSLMLTGVRNVALVYSWRVSPSGGTDQGHFWLASTIALPGAVLLSLLLILAIIRGPVTFWRAFFGSWMAVAVAAMLAGYARGLIVDRGFGGAVGGAQPSRPEQALFGALAPGSVVFLAGAVLGLVVAVVVAIVARVSRRAPTAAAVPEPVAEAPVAEPDAPPPYYPPASEAGGAPWQQQRYGPSGTPAAAGGIAATDDPSTERTSALPSLDKQSAQSDRSGTTSQLPVVDESAATSAFRRPSDTETDTGTDTDTARTPAGTEPSPHASRAAESEPARSQTTRPDPTPVVPDETARGASAHPAGDPDRHAPDSTQAMPAVRDEPAGDSDRQGPDSTQAMPAVRDEQPAPDEAPGAAPAGEAANAPVPDAAAPADAAAPSGTAAPADEPVPMRERDARTAETRPPGGSSGRTEPAGWSAPVRQPGSAQRTARFPRPPDDEDFDPEHP